MPTLGTELLSYTGNSGLAQGSGSPVVGAGDNNVINQTNRDLMMINHENNVMKWQQKQKDREAELKAIDAGQVETGDILPQDRKVVDDAQKKADDSFYKMVTITDKGSDAYKKAAIDYKSQLKATKDAATWAQYRKQGRDKLLQDKSGMTLKEDQDKVQQHIDEQDKQGFYDGQYTPYQKSLDYDAGKIISDGWEGVSPTGASTYAKKVTKVGPDGKETVTNTQTNAPLKGVKGQQAVSAGTGTPTAEDSSTSIVKRDGKVYSVTQNKVDFDKIKQNQLQSYTEGAGAFENQKMHLQAVQSLPDAQYEDYANHILTKVAQFDNDNQYQIGDPKYLDVKDLASKLGIDTTTGKRIPGSKIMLSTPDFAAYTALAAYNGSYAPKTETFLKDESEFDLKKGLNDANIFYKNALGTAALRKANAYAAHLGAKIKAIKSTEEQDKFIDNLYNRNLTAQKSLITGAPNAPGKVNFAPIDAQNSLPVLTFDGNNPKQLKPIGSTDIVDNAGHIIGYKGGHWNQEYQKNGKSLTPQQVADEYKDFLKNTPAVTVKKLGINSYDDYLKEAINNEIYDVKLIGENGSTDRKLSKAALKAISNKVTKKDQEGVFEEPPPQSEQAIE